jgi:hypothetical protein
MVKRSDDITEATIEGSAARLSENANENRTSSLELVDANESDRTEDIRAKIEETRAGMGETIDAIQERLSFANISEQVSEQVSNALETAKETVYDATIGKVVDLMRNTGNGITGSPVVRTVANNPLPFILIGAGAGLLAYQGFSKKSSGSRGASEGRYLRSGEQEENSSYTATAQDAVSSAGDRVANATETAYTSVTRAAQNTYAGAGELANRAVEKAGNWEPRYRKPMSTCLKKGRGPSALPHWRPEPRSAWLYRPHGTRTS